MQLRWLPGLVGVHENVAVLTKMLAAFNGAECPCWRCRAHTPIDKQLQQPCQPYQPAAQQFFHATTASIFIFLAPLPASSFL